MIVRTLGSKVLWLNQHEHSLEQLCEECRDDDEEGNNELRSHTTPTLSPPNSNQINGGNGTNFSKRNTYKQDDLESVSEMNNNEGDKTNRSSFKQTSEVGTPRVPLGKRTLEPQKRLI